MPTQIPPTPDDITGNADQACAHVSGAAPNRSWLCKAESGPKPPSNAYELRNSGAGFSSRLESGTNVYRAGRDLLTVGLTVCEPKKSASITIVFFECHPSLPDDASTADSSLGT
jgi:hypothetical protein